MDDLFVGKYRSKSTDELAQIAKNSKYHDGARKAAVAVLTERGKFEPTSVRNSDYSKQDLDDLLAGLQNYRIQFTKTSDSLTVFKDDWNGVTGTILLLIGVALILTYGVLRYLGNTYWGLKYALVGGLTAAYLGWNRIDYSNYSYLKIGLDGVTIKKGIHLTKRVIEIDKRDFVSFSVRDYRNSVSIFLNSKTARPLGIANFRKKDYEVTKSYVERLTEELNGLVAKLGNTWL
ncbi:MAG: hypothetical protein RIB71_15265 [Imperialibacter sp.]|uniref:hypothetical protein n=1 Tax=Imperialibacter sp. TaxID=2038411 RepID=UPI0032EE027F